MIDIYRIKKLIRELLFFVVFDWKIRILSIKFMLLFINNLRS